MYKRYSSSLFSPSKHKVWLAVCIIGYKTFIQPNYYDLKSFLLNDTSTVSIFLITFPEIMNREEISFKKSANSCVTKEA